MNIDQRYIKELGQLMMRCHVIDRYPNWDSLSIVFDINEGHMANSGFIYSAEKIMPAIAEVEHEPLALDNKIIEFREAIFEACGHKFVQLLIQMNSAGKIHIDFEFDNPKRWNMGPANYRAMREQLRPAFD